MSTAAGPVDGTVVRLAAVDQPTRDAARRAAEAELARPEYAAHRPSLLTRAVGRVARALGRLLDEASAHVPGGRGGVVLLLLLLVLVAALVLARLRPAARQAASAPLFAGAARRTADEHRSLAEAAAQQGRWADAVRERLRAVVRELEDRGVLDPRPGRTAGEVAADAGAVAPALVPALHAAAHSFDEVWYGGRPADAAAYAVQVELDRSVRAARPVLT